MGIPPARSSLAEDSRVSDATNQVESEVCPSLNESSARIET
jgi:hypothetical protein